MHNLTEKRLSDFSDFRLSTNCAAQEHFMHQATYFVTICMAEANIKVIMYVHNQNKMFSADAFFEVDGRKNTGKM